MSHRSARTGLLAASLVCLGLASGPALALNAVCEVLPTSDGFAALRAGAGGYILKDATKEEIRRAVQAVGHGEAIFGAAVAARVMAAFAQPRPASAPRPFPELTTREHDILALIARGWSNGRIADHLSLSGKTVSNYVSNILSKLQVTARAEAAERAREAGLGQES